MCRILQFALFYGEVGILWVVRIQGPDWKSARTRLANQIQYFRIPDRWEFREKVYIFGQINDRMFQKMITKNLKHVHNLFMHTELKLPVLN